ncbi:aminotransferase class III-fold pyridoxal phosphate-dependent enzyme, partial [Candidatus Pseudothioglobus singularis]|nr:aminotransferase class III-fold pyridoxal phosphate-dependent enzyme [Candidatus Pseudothioglobus singularis]
MKVVAIIQARMGSTRLPGKVMMKINQTPMIELLINRLLGSNYIDQIVLATSNNEDDLTLAKYVEDQGYEVFIGDEHDVLNRYFFAAKEFDADIIVRITGDCPLIDRSIVDKVIKGFIDSHADYASNREPPSFPDGLDVEVISFEALEDTYNNAISQYQREHVTPYIIDSKSHKKFYLKSYSDLSSERWTVDEIDDFIVVQNIFNYFHPKIDFTWKDIMQLKDSNPKLFKDNKHLIRNEGSNMGNGQKLWTRAKRVIPGGNMLLSKRSEMFLPNQWPSYFQKAKGCKIWDLDGREYVDMSIMGIGTNILGYGNDEVDEAVLETVKNGNMSTFNCPEEVYLAEKLVELHPWADMARLARTGGEANAVAIRIARASSGKDKVAICGYHGWHDWYLSANLGDVNNLSGHLLPGLQPNGVPKDLKGSVIPFNYNCINELEDIVKNHDIGSIKMEVARNSEPQNDFLLKVRKIANDNNIILIFDECTSGFRQSNGGLHKIYNVEPDMAIFGKALGNGYAITAVIGKKEIMDVAQSTFISSTFWTERIGPTAALKTLELMNKSKSWELITKIGKDIGSHWQKLGKKYQLKILVRGLPSMIGFTIE